MVIFGIILVLLGITDVGMTYLGTDIWSQWFGIQVPEDIWPYTAYIAMGAGYVLISFGRKGDDDTETDEA